MKLNYDNFAKTFSNSRKNMKWEEIDYFLDNYIEKKDNIKILDIWCGNGRLLSHIKGNEIYKSIDYTWVDLSDWLIREAQEIHPENNFYKVDMLNLSSIEEKFDYIFFIASFHHLNSTKDRKKVIKSIKKILKDDWIIFMTNCCLRSEINLIKYEKSIIDNSKNTYWSYDYHIKIWNFIRYYHCFSIEELEFLFINENFELIENREFENKKNIISIIKNKSLL